LEFGLSVSPARPRRAASSDAGAHRTPWWKRWLLVPIVLLLCAIVPWLVPWPWQDPGPGSVAEPPAASAASGPDGASPSTTDEQPTDDTVEKLGKKLAGQAEAYDLPVDRGEVKGVSTKPGPYTELGRIAISRIGLDVPFGEGVFAETLNRGPGHWPGTPMPGRAGNSVISGHRNTNTRPFLRIDELKPGDEITVTLKGQEPATFRVDDTTIVPEAKYRDVVLRQPGDTRARQLTIFACHPEGNPINRIIVRSTAVPA
jgi:LPXTG-site transpeptidase (sortase) family protein